MTKESDLDKAIRLKGYGSAKEKFSESNRDSFESVKKAGKLSVKPKIITCLREYIDFIETLETSYENPVFYRGQGNANYLINPGALRINPQNEQRMIESFSRRFPDVIDSCINDMSRLVLMQHYGLSTRALDISENPLAALYFACSPMKKFNKNPEKEKSSWGEITIFREPQKEDEKKPYNLKEISSTTVSVISSTAFMEEDFNLWQLGMEYKKDNNLMREERHIPLLDIVRRSVIVRVPQNNPRIKNQQGAFILVNANEITEMNYHDTKTKELTEEIINDYDREITLDSLLNNTLWKKVIGTDKTWEFRFKKIKPYSGQNRIEIFDTDPFNLHDLFYKNKKGQQVVMLIPPEKKTNIISELERFNITEDFIYPDMDCVANEINERINKE